MRARILTAACAGTLLISGCASSGSSTQAGSSSQASASSPASTSAAATGQATACPPADGSAKRVTSFAAAPPMCIDASKKYTATMTTDAGTMTLALDPAKAPKAVNNFVVLSRYHFYDGLTFHRVIKGFMIQGGDPAGNGTGGPGYAFEDELPATPDYTTGTLAMANAGPGTQGSQFFIVSAEPGASLPADYTIFGKLTNGMNVLKAIEADGGTGQAGTPAKVHAITSVTITEQ